jgi:translation initiation factor 2A
MSSPTTLVLRGSSGLATITQDGRERTWTTSDGGPKDFSKACRVMAFSRDGALFAWSNGETVEVCAADKAFSPVCSLPASRVSFLSFSPSGTVLSTWEVFAIKAGQDAKPNLNLWEAKTGKHLAAFVAKKNAWWQPQWSGDEALCMIRTPNNEIAVYKDANFETVDKRLSLAKMDSFSLSPNGAKVYPVVCFVPGQKGGPGFGKLYNYPNFNAEKDVVANKSFFQSDRMDVEWSHDGHMALLLTQSEVDKTGASYYGKQQLYYVNCSGDTALVELTKNGPIYSITWNPTRPEFCVVYGFMPAKATVYNSKCDKVFDYGTGSRNQALYNPQGNLLLLGGFGNLRGAIEVWSVKDKKIVSQFDATDSTDVRWSPSGQFLMTSTCAPRLRVGNGVKIWHYSSALLHETIIEDGTKEELWEVAWRNELNCPDFSVSYAKIQGIPPKQPQASKVAYRPPNVRNKAKPGFTFALEENEPPQAPKAENETPLSKSAIKNKKRKENKKADPAENANHQGNGVPVAAAAAPAVPGEAEKMLRKLTQKLQKIEELRAKQREGKELELNQLEKLKTEKALVEQIKQLKLQSGAN